MPEAYHEQLEGTTESDANTPNQRSNQLSNHSNSERCMIPKRVDTCLDTARQAENSFLHSFDEASNVCLRNGETMIGITAEMTRIDAIMTRNTTSLPSTIMHFDLPKLQPQAGT